MFYEMLVGLPPFYSQNRQEMFQSTLKANVTVPDFVSPTAKDFILRLLRKRPEERLGSGAAEGQEVKDHPIFKNIDWAALEKRQVQPPFKPKFKVCASFFSFPPSSFFFTITFYRNSH